MIFSAAVELAAIGETLPQTTACARCTCSRSNFSFSAPRSASNSVLPILETLGVVQAAQRTLKRKLGPRFDQAAKLSEDHATGRYGCELRSQRRNSTGNQIGVNEVNEPSNPRQIFTGKCCLSSSIGSGDDNASWF
jgi:hypothetical protein